MAIRMTSREPLTQQAKAKPIAARVEPVKPAIETPKAIGRPSSGRIMVTLRLDPDVIAKFKATGPGWQSRMNDVLAAAKV